MHFWCIFWVLFAAIFGMIAPCQHTVYKVQKAYNFGNMVICTLLERENMLGGLNYIIMSMHIVPWSTVRFHKFRCLLFEEERSNKISEKYMFMKWSRCDALVILVWSHTCWYEYFYMKLAIKTCVPVSVWGVYWVDRVYMYRLCLKPQWRWPMIVQWNLPNLNALRLSGKSFIFRGRSGLGEYCRQAKNLTWDFEPTFSCCVQKWVKFGWIIPTVWIFLRTVYKNWTERGRSEWDHQ